MPDAAAHVSVLWRRLDHPGLELCELNPGADSVLSGAVLALPDAAPMRVDYAIQCTPDWQTTRAVVDMRHGPLRVLLELSCDEDRRWRRDGVHVAALDGCADVDLSVTPSTNTLPIRRLSLAMGESRDVAAAWIRLPECEVSPLPQRYTRIGERRYLYESRGGAFTAELEVDEHGLVLDYPPAWERVRR
jgi:hypothetical protein